MVADSPFLPAHGDREREHLGLVRAAADTAHLGLLVVPSFEPLPLAPYREVVGGVPLLVTRRSRSKLLLASPTTPYAVSSRPARPGLVERARELAPDATGVVVLSFKSWRVGEALARGLGLPAVLRQHRLEGRYHRDLAAGAAGPRRLAVAVEARRIERDERRVDHAPWLSATADISATDAAVRRERGARAVHLPPFAYDPSLVDLSRPPQPSSRVLFVGALDVAANITALSWVLTGVWQSIRAEFPTAVLDVVGRGPTGDLRRRLEAEPGVELHADVADVHPFLARATVAINPAAAGSGVTLALIDSLQAGLPVVSTSLGAQSLGDGDALVVQDDAPSFAAAVCALLADPGLAAQHGESGRRQVMELLDPAANIARLEVALSPASPAHAEGGPRSPSAAEPRVPATPGPRRSAVERPPVIDQSGLPRLHVVMRCHGGENRKNRPDFYDKTVCLASLIRAAESVRPAPALMFLNDGPIPPRRERLMLSAGEVVQGEFGSNRRSYRAMLTTVSQRVGDDDLVWFAEDDYLYAPGAFEELLDAAARLRTADYFSLYLGELDDPDSTRGAGNTTWGPAVSTTSSFGVRGRQLREDVALLRLMPFTGGAFDHTTCLTLQGRYPFTPGELLDDLVPVGASVGEWPRSVSRGLVRLALGLRSWRRPSRRRVLVQPPRDLIAHLEVGAFEPSDGWEPVAESSRDWAAERLGEAAGATRSEQA